MSKRITDDSMLIEASKCTCHCHVMAMDYKCRLDLVYYYVAENKYLIHTNRHTK